MIAICWRTIMKPNVTVQKVMHQAIEKARETMNNNLGGPFGAAIIDELGDVVAVTSNSVLNDHDPTAHAEMNAIREASKKRASHDLSGCTLITTAYPCPMCLGAIIWANITTVIYGCRPKDAERIGFRDDFIYDFIKKDCNDPSVLQLSEDFRDRCLKLFEEYKEKNKTIY